MYDGLGCEEKVLGNEAWIYSWNFYYVLSISVIQRYESHKDKGYWIYKGALSCVFCCSLSFLFSLRLNAISICYFMNNIVVSRYTKRSCLVRRSSRTTPILHNYELCFITSSTSVVFLRFIVPRL